MVAGDRGSAGAGAGVGSGSGTARLLILLNFETLPANAHQITLTKVTSVANRHSASRGLIPFRIPREAQRVKAAAAALTHHNKRG